jgi:hypothetical protein
VRGEASNSYSPLRTLKSSMVSQRTRSALSSTCLFKQKPPPVFWGKQPTTPATFSTELAQHEVVTDVRPWNAGLRFDSNTSSAFKKCRVWGCAAYPHTAHGARGPRLDKLEPRVKHEDGKLVKHIFVGIDEDHQAYRLMERPYFKLSRSAHVTFNEEDFPCRSDGPSSIRQLIAPFTKDLNEDFPVQGNAVPTAGATRPTRTWHPSPQALQNIADSTSYANETLSYCLGVEESM